jgi:hypothetical protein
VVARVKVDKEGVAHDCSILVSSKSKSLDAVTCRVLMRNRYDPAISKAGQPAASNYITQMNWRIGG